MCTATCARLMQALTRTRLRDQPASTPALNHTQPHGTHSDTQVGQGAACSRRRGRRGRWRRRFRTGRRRRGRRRRRRWRRGAGRAQQRVVHHHRGAVRRPAAGQRPAHGPVAHEHQQRQPSHAGGPRRRNGAGQPVGGQVHAGEGTQLRPAGRKQAAQLVAGKAQRLQRRQHGPGVRKRGREGVAAQRQRLQRAQVRDAGRQRTGQPRAARGQAEVQHVAGAVTRHTGPATLGRARRPAGQRRRVA